MGSNPGTGKMEQWKSRWWLIKVNQTREKTLDEDTKTREKTLDQDTKTREKTLNEDTKIFN